MLVLTQRWKKKGCSRRQSNQLLDLQPPPVHIAEVLMSKSIFASFLSSHSHIIEESQLSPRGHKNASNYSPSDGISCRPYPLYACGLVTIVTHVSQCKLWVCICIYSVMPGTQFFLDVMNHPWMLQSFCILFHKDPCTLQVNMHVPYRAEHAMVLYSLHTEKWECVSVLTAINGKERLLWWGLRDALI